MREIFILFIISQRLEETKIMREKCRKLKVSDTAALTAKPLFRSALEELLDAGVDDRQIVDEFNTMMFGVSAPLMLWLIRNGIRFTCILKIIIGKFFKILGSRNWC